MVDILVSLLPLFTTVYRLFIADGIYVSVTLHVLQFSEHSYNTSVWAVNQETIRSVRLFAIRGVATIPKEKFSVVGDDFKNMYDSYNTIVLPF